jgi:hypothetical protein
VVGREHSLRAFALPSIVLASASSQQMVRLESRQDNRLLRNRLRNNHSRKLVVWTLDLAFLVLFVYFDQYDYCAIISTVFEKDHW